MVSETISELRVRYAETDQMGVVYHANYLVWCELGRTDFIRALGKSYAELERDGVLWVALGNTAQREDVLCYSAGALLTLLLDARSVKRRAFA